MKHILFIWTATSMDISTGHSHLKRSRKPRRKKSGRWLSCFIFLWLSCTQAFAQNPGTLQVAVTRPYHLFITYFKTINLEFPYPIKSVDRGTGDVLAQKFPGVDNVLQVKARRQGFDQTNLTVITADGRLYSYLVDYAKDPDTLNLSFGAPTRADPSPPPASFRAFFSPGIFNEAELKTTSEAVAGKDPELHGIRDKAYGVKLWLTGLYIRNMVLYGQIRIANRSAINYDIDQFRFFLGDRHEAKRTATQEIDLAPLYMLNDTSIIAAGQVRTLVFALSKIILADQKYLGIYLSEKNGGRDLKLTLLNKTLLKAIPLSQ